MAIVPTSVALRFRTYLFLPVIIIFFLVVIILNNSTLVNHIFDNESIKSNRVVFDKPPINKIAYINVKGLLISDSDGSNEQLLVTQSPDSDTLIDGPLSWSPDNSKITFIKEGKTFPCGGLYCGEAIDLYYYDLLSGTVHNVKIPNNDGIASIIVDDVYPVTWAPDSLRFAYVQFSYNPRTYTIQIYDTNTKKQREIYAYKKFSENNLIWSPDGTRILIPFDEAVEVIDTAGNLLYSITPESLGFNNNAIGMISWLADWAKKDNEILISEERRQPKTIDVNTLYKISLSDNSTVTRKILNQNTSKLKYYPHLSPKQNYLLGYDKYHKNGTLLDSNGKKLKNKLISGTQDVNYVYISWSPNEDKLALSATFGKNNWIVSTDGSSRQFRTGNFPTWSN